MTFAPGVPGFFRRSGAAGRQRNFFWLLAPSHEVILLASGPSLPPFSGTCISIHAFPFHSRRSCSYRFFGAAGDASPGGNWSECELAVDITTRSCCTAGGGTACCRITVRIWWE
ncbi:unnamed protein product [Urochloa humidicola]